MLKAFTLIELLIVLSILVILMSLVIPSSPEVDDELAVHLAAYELQSTILKARSLAMKTGNVYAITFHIENDGDGRVMKNYADEATENDQGNHWYSIIGPQVELTYWAKSQPPEAVRYANKSIEEFEQAVTMAQIGERHYLPYGTRLVALSDLDFGTFPSSRFLSTTHWFEEYPRPWFGVLQPDNVAVPAPPSAGQYVLYPWGGYDCEWEAAQAPRSGHGQNSQQSNYPRSGFNHRGDLDPGASTVPVTWATGPIVNGLLMDVTMVFFPSGRCSMERKFDAQRYLINQDSADGKHRLGTTNAENSDHTIGMRYGAVGPEYDTRVTGGYHITIARDVNSEDDIYPVPGRFDIFENEADALKSMTPFRRVFVQEKTSQVSIRDEAHAFCQIKMNQKNLTIHDAGIQPPDGSNNVLFRPAHRGIGFTLFLDPSVQDVDWTDEGWKGWFPSYAP